MDIQSFPSKPGVYLMKNAQGVVMYVGKAKNLRKRLQQYFSLSDGRPQIPILVKSTVEVETIVVSSEKEALLLENTLIKKHKPKFNVLLKDDKSYISLKITKHKWPALQLTRYKGAPKKDGIYFGPYTSAYHARETLDLLQRLFPLRECSDRELKSRARPCILYQMHRCLAPCCDRCSPEEYIEVVHQVKQFLLGNNKKVIDDLRKKMEKHSEKLEFEKAQSILNTIRALEDITEKQHVASVKDINEDVISLIQKESQSIITKLVFKNGLLTGSQSFVLNHYLEDETEVLSSFLLQHYLPPIECPKKIFLSHKLTNFQELSEILSNRYADTISIHTPQKGKMKSVLKLAMENGLAYYEQICHKQAKLESILIQVQEKLELTNYPEVIECFDNSHLAGSSMVSALVTYVNGTRDKKRTRYFHLKAKPSDDIGAMKEVLRRRLIKGHKEGILPDLIILDGGLSQLRAGLSILEELNIASVDLISLAKEKGRHDKGLASEVIYTKQEKTVKWPSKSEVLFLFQRIRDSAHEVVLAFHKKTRHKTLFNSSLTEIPGIGPKKQRALLKHFGSIDAIAKATQEELEQLSSITQKDANTLKKFLNKD